MMLKQHSLLLLILSVSVFSFSAYAVDSSELDDTEMLLFDDIPSVFSASKYEQKVTEAPARINIVTAKEIVQGYLFSRPVSAEKISGLAQHDFKSVNTDNGKGFTALSVLKSG